MRVKSLLLFIVICLTLTASSLGPGLSGNFLWDDEEQIINNIPIHNISNLPHFFFGSTFNTGGAGGALTGIYYRPTMMIAFNILYSLFGANPTAFHVVQLMLHVTNATLVMLLMATILRHVSITSKERHYYEYIAGVAGLVFALHPMNVETSLYISVYQDILLFTFGMSAIVLLQYITRVSIGNFVGFTILLILSLLSKETGVAFLGIAVVYILLFKRTQKLILILAPVFSFVVYVFLRFGIARVMIGDYSHSAVSKLSLVERFITMPKIIWTYLGNYIFPSFSPIAQHWVVKSLSWERFWVPFVCILILFIMYVIAVYRLRSKELIFFGIWVCFGLSIHLQIFPLDMTVADRWFYIAQVGVLGIFAVLSLYVFEYKSRILRYVVIGACGICITYSMYRSHERAFAWQDGLSLYETDMQTNPDAFDIQNNYGVELVRLGKYDEALPHFLRSIELEETWRFPWNNAGVVYEQKGDLEQAKKYYMESIKRGKYYLGFENYANVLIKQGRYKEAQSFIEQALRYLPQNERLNSMKEYLQQTK